jgi:hypothetical protein
MGLVKKGPDVASAAKVGEPNLVEPTPIAPTDVIKQEALGAMEPARKGVVGVTIVAPDQPVPDSSTPPTSDTANPASPFGQPTTAAGAQPAASDPNELKPNQPADPNELKPTDSGDQALPPPAQVNEIQSGQSSSTATADNSAPATDEEISSSKKKKKKGMKKIVPF